MQQAARVSDYTAFMYLGELIEFDKTEQDLHRAARPAHAGLHHRPLRLTAESGQHMMTEHTVKAFDNDLQELDPQDRRDGRPRRARGRRRDRGADPPRHRRWRSASSPPTATIDALQREIEEKADPHHRPAPADGGRPARDRRRDPRRRAISSASATSPRTSPSASSRSKATSIRSKLLRGVEHMAELVLGAAQGRARRLCRAATSPRALAVWKRDEEIDAMYTSLFRELLTYMMEDPRNITLLHASAVLRQEHRAHRRPRHQHRRDRALPGRRQAACRRAAEAATPADVRQVRPRSRTDTRDERTHS